jgi:hypothetical protein
MGIRPMLGSVSWGPYSHKAHALSFQLLPHTENFQKTRTRGSLISKSVCNKNKPHKTRGYE